MQDIFIIVRKICMIKVFLNSMVETDTFSQEWINCSIRYDKWSHGTLGLNMAHAVCWHYHTTVLHHGRSLSAHKSETKGKNLWANSLKKSLVQKGHAIIKETHQQLPVFTMWNFCHLTKHFLCALYNKRLSEYKKTSAKHLVNVPNIHINVCGTEDPYP